MTLAELLEHREDLLLELAQCEQELLGQAGPCNLCGADDTVRLQSEVWGCESCGFEFSPDDVRIMAVNRQHLVAFLAGSTSN